MQDRKPHKINNSFSDCSGIPMIVAFFPMDSSGMESFLLLLRFSFLLPINVGWISPSHHTCPSEHIGTVGICPNHFQEKSSLSQFRGFFFEKNTQFCLFFMTLIVLNLLEHPCITQSQRGGRGYKGSCYHNHVLGKCCCIISIISFKARKSLV